METLKDVASYSGKLGKGHYEATVNDDGSVVMSTIIDGSPETHEVKLTRGEWERLATWVVWAQTELEWKK